MPASKPTPAARNEINTMRNRAGSAIRKGETPEAASGSAPVGSELWLLSLSMNAVSWQ